MNSNGTLDYSFDVGTGANNVIYTVLILSDGKILIGGDFTSFNGTSVSRFARLNSDGSLDNSLNIGTGFNYAVKALAINRTGKYIVGGDFTNYNGTNRNAIVTLEPNGTPLMIQINGFSPGTRISSIFVTLNNNVLIGGYFNTYGGTTVNGLVRVTMLGTIDKTFAPKLPPGTTIYKVIHHLSQNRIYICGENISNVRIFARLQPNGSLDNEFNIGSGFSGIVRNFIIQSDNKIVVSGYFWEFNSFTVNAITRLNPDGSRDTTFNKQTGANKKIKALKITSDKKIYIGGFFYQYNGINTGALIRLNQDGTQDTSFTPVIYPYVTTFAIQPDQKVLVATSSKELKRYNPSGSLDNSFQGATFDNHVNALCILNDKILAVGLFTSLNGISSNRIIKLNSNGTIDLTFNPGSGANNNILAILPDASGKVIIAGAFTQYDGNTANRLAKINSDGSFDNTFNIGSGANDTIFCIAIQNDGKILAGGSFTTWNGTTKNRIVRLNSDGTLDPSFNIGSGFNQKVNNILVLDDGFILVSGTFTAYNGTSRKKLALLAPNGMISPYFNSEYGPNGLIYTMEKQSLNKIILGGDFTAYHNIGRNRIARILNCYHSSNEISVTACKNYTAPDGQVYTESGTYIATIPNATGCDSVITINLTIETISYTIGLNGNVIEVTPSNLSYQWLNCETNEVILGENSSIFTPTANGSYAAIISNGVCTDTTNCVGITFLNNSTPDIPRFTVYPNPAHHSLIINGVELVSRTRYEIITITGAIVDHGDLNTPTISINKLPDGIYYLKICTNQTTHLIKFVKLR